jgi:competence protein ComEC
MTAQAPGWQGRRRPDSSFKRVATSLREGLAEAGSQRRHFVPLPFGLIVGLVVYAALPEEPGLPFFALGTLLVCAALLRAMLRQSLAGVRVAVQLWSLWAGFCLLPAHALTFGTEMLRFPSFGHYAVLVDEVLSTDAAGRRVVVSELTPVDGARAVPIRRARLLVPLEPVLEPGDRFSANLRLTPVPGPVLPGTHDGQFHSYFAGIGAYGGVTSGLEVLSRGDDTDIGRRVQALRNHIGGRVDLALAPDSAAIGRAMMVGDQSAITDEIRDVMAASGLAHVYSISGLHLSIVAGGIFWLVRLALASLPMLVAWPSKKIAAIAGLLAAFGYLLLAGGPDNVPAFRSTLMLALIFGAALVGRRALTMRNVAIAALVIIVLEPTSVFRPSFQLSFAAVVALIGVYELPRRAGAGKYGALERFFRFVLATAATSFIAGLATLLFSAYHFQQTAPLGVLGNVLALPFVSFIMWFGVLAVVAMPFGVDGPFLQLMGWNIDRMVDVAELVAGWSAGFTGNPLLTYGALLVGLASLAWFAFLAGRWRFLGPVLAVPFVLLFGFAARPDVLIADTTQAIAIRDGDGDGLALASGRTGSFAVDVWSRHYQAEIAASHSGARCDGLGCIVSNGAFTTTIVRNAAAFAEDCFGNDLVISRAAVPAWCRSGNMVIGPYELERHGVHWLAWDAAAGRFDVRPAIVHINRPWRVWRQ